METLDPRLDGIVGEFFPAERGHPDICHLHIRVGGRTGGVTKMTFRKLKGPVRAPEIPGISR